MANKLDVIIVVDIECTCWDKKTPARLQESEIVEIGVCIVCMAKLAPISKESILVQPQNSAISNFCTNLTTITQEIVDKDGMSFREACSLLRSKYNSNNRLWASWGDYDRRQFERQCKKTCYNAQYPFGPTHINFKNLFAITMGLSREVGMGEALKLLGMDLEGTHHRGVDDAQNIAKIACRLLKAGREKIGQR